MGWEQLNIFMQNAFVSLYGLLFMAVSLVFFWMYKEDLFDYYVKKGFLLFTGFFLLSWVTLARQIGFSISLTYAKDVLKAFLLRTVCEEYWIFYTLFGIYLIIPFMKRMMQGLDEKEKRALLWVLTGYFAFFTGGVLLNYKITLYAYPFLNWVTYALAGYLVLHIDWSVAERKKFYVFGVAAFVLSSIEALCFPGINWSLDTFCLSRILICMSIFLWLSKRRWRHV